MRNAYTKVQRSLPSVANLVTYGVVPKIGGIWNHLKNRSMKLCLDYFVHFFVNLFWHKNCITKKLCQKMKKILVQHTPFSKSIPKTETQDLGTQSIILAAMMTNHEFSQPGIKENISSNQFQPTLFVLGAWPLRRVLL